MKKQLLSIGLLLTLIAPLVLTFLYLKNQQLNLKHEVKEQIIKGIDRSDLVLIKISKESELEVLEWEHETEFKYQGKMYDVVEKLDSNQMTYYYCWQDEEDNKLEQQLHRLINEGLQSNPQRKKKQSHLLQFFKSLYWEKQPSLTLFSESNSREYTNFLQLSSLNLNSPPPLPPPQNS